MANRLQRKRRKNFIKKAKKIALIIISGTIILFSPHIMARYAYNGIKSFFSRNNKFYFNCDKLSENGSNIEMTNWSGVGQYTVKFNMNSNLNKFVHSEDDIEYDIEYSCSDNVTCSIQNNKTTGIISKETNSDDFSIVITVPTDTILKDNDVVELNVETTSTSPYTKKIYGTFKLVVGHYGLSYEIEDKKNQPYLIIKNTNTLDYYIIKESFEDYEEGSQIDMETYQNLSDTDKKKCVSATITLNFDPEKILLDMTSEVYKNAKSITTVTLGEYEYINSISFNIDAMTSNNIRFYKQNISNNYSYPNSGSDSIIEVIYS